MSAKRIGGELILPANLFLRKRTPEEVVHFRELIEKSLSKMVCVPPSAELLPFPKNQ